MSERKLPIWNVASGKQGRPSRNGVRQSRPLKPYEGDLRISRLRQQKKKESDSKSWRWNVASRAFTAQWVKLDELSVDRSKPLGRGGFGEVFRGRYMDMDVAVKFMLDTDEKSQASFRSEITVWADLPHSDYVVPLIGYRTDPTFMVTHLYAGGSLVAYLSSLGWPRAESLRLLIHVARGLAFLHSKGILHCDVKGENALVDLSDPERPVAKIADFGLAKTRTSILNTVGNKAYQYKGMHGYTLAFAAPEMFDGDPPRKPVDVWSFAMMLYQVLAKGKQPYGDLSGIPAMTKAIVMGKPPTRTADMGDDVWAILERCWALDPEARPTMDQVVEDLSKLVPRE
ncbi:kinase-like domain-containing protein [Hyaloraphidium curvatum]|nr:kinase-like domain-containing protein [Hyaloraphidium curvatum]